MAASMGSRMRALREARGWSLAEAAIRISVGKLRVTRGAVSHYEHDRRVPGPKRMRRIAAVYGTTVGHLYGEDRRRAS